MFVEVVFAFSFWLRIHELCFVEQSFSASRSKELSVRFGISVERGKNSKDPIIGTDNDFRVVFDAFP